MLRWWLKKGSVALVSPHATDQDAGPFTRVRHLLYRVSESAIFGPKPSIPFHMARKSEAV